MLTYVKEGKIVKVKGDPNHPLTQGFLCPKAERYVDYIYGKDRILYPHKSVGKKGEGKFKRISWNEAYSVILRNLKGIEKQYGAEAVLPYDYSGNLAGVVNHYFPYRFFNKYGSSILLHTICSAAGKVAFNYTYGTYSGMDPLELLNSKLIIAWGFNPAWTNPHGFNLIRKARKNNQAKFIVIDPVKTETALKADLHLQPYPGTDSALALAIMNEIISKGLYDKEFVDNYTVGFNKLAERVKEYPPERGAKTTGVATSDIVRVAELYATVKPAAIHVGLALQRNVNGGEMVRAISCLPALTGNLGKKGAGFIYSNTLYKPIDLNAIQGVFLGTGKKRRTINMIKLGEVLLDPDLEPPIKMLFVFNSNPAAVCPDQNKVRQGLSREDLFTVVHDVFFTDTVDYADIALPATTFFEQKDVNFSYYGLYVSINEKAIDPLGESKSNHQLFTELAERMGYTEKPFLETAEEVMESIFQSRHPWLKGITLEILKKKGFAHLTTPTIPYIAFEEKRFKTPSGKVEFYSEKALEDDYDPLPTYTPTKRDKRYPIRLITPLSKYLIHSQFHNIPIIRKWIGEPTIEINEKDAAKRDVKDGNWVFIKNQRGKCKLRAKISDRVREGTAVAISALWPKLSPDRKNVNFTTSDQEADMGGNSTFHTNYVEIRRA